MEEKQPFGVIPVLIDTNGYKIYGLFFSFKIRKNNYCIFKLESRAICRYLEAKYKGHGTELIPSNDVQAQSLFEQAASIETSYFDPYASVIVYERAFKK